MFSAYHLLYHWRLVLQIKLNRSIDDFSSRRANVRVDSTPVMPRVLNDQRLNRRVNRRRLPRHELGVFYRNGCVLVALNH